MKKASVDEIDTLDEEILKENKDPNIPEAVIPNESKVDFLGVRPVSTSPNEKENEYISGNVHADIISGVCLGIFSNFLAYLGIIVMIFLIVLALNKKKVRYFAIPWAIVFFVPTLTIMTLVSASV